jgi:hypothetical protein
MNPNFFEGTQVEKEAAAILGRLASEPAEPRAAKWRRRRALLSHSAREGGLWSQRPKRLVSDEKK